MAKFARLFARRPARTEVDARRASLGTLVIFLAPALLIYAAFSVYPVLRTFYNSVHTIKPRGVEMFVGLANFDALLHTDLVFWKAVGNTAIFAIVATIADVLGGLLLALCLFSRAPFASLLRLVWFTPVLMSYVVVGIIWVWIYDYDWGLANAILHRQDDDLRPRLDHDGRRPAVVDRDGVDLCLQARLRLEHLRFRLSLGDRGPVVRHHPRFRRRHDAAAAPTRQARVLAG